MDHSVVGGGHAPLLDVVPIDVKQDMTCFTPMHITYKRLIRKTLDAITIQISSEVGRMLKYSQHSHPVTLRLHIKENEYTK